MQSNMVVAAIISKNGKILIAKRNNKGALANLWEFPGGKVEIGENLESCLERELKEELGIKVRVGQLFDSTEFVYNGLRIRLFAFKVSALSDDFKLIEHQEIKWVELKELPNFNFVEGDLPIVKRLVQDNARQTKN